MFAHVYVQFTTFVYNLSKHKTQRRHHQKSKTEASVAPQKGLVSSKKFFFKKKVRNRKLWLTWNHLDKLILTVILLVHKYVDRNCLAAMLAAKRSAGVTPAIAVYVGCMYDPVISVRFLRLSHNNSMNYSWCIYCWRYCTTYQYQTTTTCRGVRLWL